MANKSEVMSAVSSLVDYMKKQTTMNLVEAANQGKVKIDQENLRKICSFVEASMTQSFINASTQVESKL